MISEGCDDFNTVALDGCSSTCAVESGWTCVGTNPSVCTAICGDAKVVATETCDDGVNNGLTGCNTNCHGWASGYTCCCGNLTSPS